MVPGGPPQQDSTCWSGDCKGLPKGGAYSLQHQGAFVTSSPHPFCVPTCPNEAHLTHGCPAG
eukprot:CAMPEP_0174359410 /NCGR_PEP_ID=MMETSP0811_2-20130205/48514_1 /TAXON_ID=73025 ORGANISM="Eutreptiella gymnastica-like, Strain CCMP1594" /NCGR_SAMPLE_ID=MMETSP0811_2 /ASSEMBLY_ACC=CAM_ASM_000667 /LENGTH=61 /DNA_ID=CAMNT_0015494107 /DNA_START=45 /DNA_END=227 /DNA_ORIENTATION=-